MVGGWWFVVDNRSSSVPTINHHPPTTIRLIGIDVDGTLLEAWASHKSFKPNDTPPDGGDDDDAVLVDEVMNANTFHRA